MDLSNETDVELNLKTDDVLTLCRSCLSRNTEMLSLFSDSTNHVPAFFDQYLQIKIERDDGLPNKLCSLCLKKLSVALSFLMQSKKSDEILQNYKYLSDIKLDNKTTDNDGKILTKRRKRLENSPIKDEIEKSKSKIAKTIVNNLISYDDYPKENVNKLSELSKDNCVISDNCDDNKSDFVLPLELQNRPNNINFDISEKQQDFESNIATETSENQIYSCQICGDIFSTSRGLRIHTRIHNQSGSLLCSTCGCSFSDAKSLYEHSLSHIKDKPYKCSYCDKKFSQKKPLQYHEKTHTGERPYVCDLCGKSYIQPNSLVIHLRSHTGEKPFVCKECGKAFTNGASLSLHMPVHTRIKDFVCTVCGKRIARSGELTIHMRTHTGEKPYICRTCSKGFIKKSALQAHMYTHTGEKKFVCPTCGHRVAHAGKLTVHMRTHSDNKPFACPICDRRFANQSYLKQHSKIHCVERSKSFVCTECGRSFWKNKNLLEHMRTHTGERPYKCTICNHGFSQKSTLNYHIKKTHDKLKSRDEPILSSDFNNVDVAKPDDISKDTNEVKIAIPAKTDIKINKIKIIDTELNNTINEIQNMSEELKPNHNSQLDYSHRILQYPTYHS